MDFVSLFFIFLLSSQQVRLSYQQNSTMFVLDQASKPGVIRSSSRQLHCARQCAHFSCCLRFVSTTRKSCRMIGADDENIVMPPADTYYTVYNRVSRIVFFWTFHTEVQSDPRKMLGSSGIKSWMQTIGTDFRNRLTGDSSPRLVIRQHLSRGG